MQKKSSLKPSIVPLGDRVLVKPFTEEELRRTAEKKSKLNLILPDSMTKEKSAQGRVVRVRVGMSVDGKRIPPPVKPGEVVVFSRYSYDEVELSGEEYYLIKEENILAVIR